MGEEASSIAPPKPSKRLTKLGIALTAIYLITIGSIAVTHREAMLSLEPNEWGDFLAGTFGPVAFLWLVLGYFQQGDELRYSAEALWLQGEELRNSVEQQRALVEATRQQVDFERESIERQREELEIQSQPIITISLTGQSSGAQETRHRFNINNAGEDCTSFVIAIEERHICRKSLISRGEDHSFSLHLPINTNLIQQIFDVSYVDKLGQHRSASYTFDGHKFVRQPDLKLNATANALAILASPGGEEPREDDRI